MQKILFLILTLVSVKVLAQESADNSTTSKTSAIRKPYGEISFGYVFWQEKMEVDLVGTPGALMASFQGLKFGYARNKPFYKVRWVQHYEANLQIGNVKARSADTSLISEEVENRSWYAVSFNPGIIYRTSSKSEVLMSVPFSNKTPKWNFKTPLTIENQAFSLGLSGSFVSRLSVRSALTFSVAHMLSWETTTWTIGYQYDFRTTEKPPTSTRVQRN